MYWFDVKSESADFVPGKFPAFTLMFGDDQDDYTYGFSSSDTAQPALKVVSEQYGVTTTPADLAREVTPIQVDTMHRSCIAGRFP